MLASPLHPMPSFSPQQTPESASQYRPARDIETFNSLLPPPIEFIEGSSSGVLAVAEGKYTPINVAPKAPSTSASTQAPPLTPVNTPKSTSTATKIASFYQGTIDATWPKSVGVGSGLYNTGNSCFLNSVLQCLLHTPPLIRVLIAHSKTDPCRVKNGFCMSCNLRDVMMDSQHKLRPFTPYPITTKLQTIAKHMRRGRQEDSHEFLRYAIDALQKSCLAGYPPTIDSKLAETTWVHKIFGGRLRSRVTCRECQHHSDTFDSILDLSLDIYGVDVLKDALRKFVTVDYLKGADKYKCEKCSKSVIAEKQFTVHEAPLVLTVHLKRFSPLGRKIGHHVKYDDHLSLQSVMSEGQHGPSYVLYGVICHAGGGPNSGHYFSHVRASDDRWYEMNDDTVSLDRGPPVGLKSAYILLYIRDKGQALEAALTSLKSPPIHPKISVAAAMKKRRVLMSDEEVEEEEDRGVMISRSFIGPQLPSTSSESDPKRQGVNIADPQAELVKKKIEAAASKKAGMALSSLSQYESEEEGEKEGAKMDREKNSAPSSQKIAASSPPPPPQSSSPACSPVTVSTSSFYSNSSKKKLEGNGKKRKSTDYERDENLRDYARSPLRVDLPKLNGSTKGGERSSSSNQKFSYGGNPFSRLSGGNNLRAGRPPPSLRYGNRRRKHII